MKAIPFLFGLGFAAALVGQSPLTTILTPGGANGAVPSPVGGVVFFTMAINTTITLERIDLNTASAVGTQGELRLYRTLPAFSSFSGSETNPANWELLATGTVWAAGLDVATTCCFDQPVTLSAGQRGYALMHIGVVPAYTFGTGTNQTFSNAQITLNAGAAATIGPYYPDGLVSPFQPGAAQFNPRVFNGRLHYSIGSTGTPCSSSNEYGPGCGGRFGSFFDLFDSPASANATLQGRSIALIPDAFPNVSSYTVVIGSGPILDPTLHPQLNGFSTTILGANPLDDGEAQVPVPGAGFPFPGGSTNTLFVHTDGMVSAGSNLAFLDTLAGDDWAPLVPALLEAPNAMWCSWHDYDTSVTGGGQIRVFDTGTTIVISWVDVESYPAGAGNPSTFQMQFDYTSGIVSMAWQTVTAVGQGGGYAGDLHLVGFSPGGSSLRPEFETDIGQNSVIPLFATADETNSLTLRASGRPVVGATMTYRTVNEPDPSAGVLFAALSDLPGISPAGLDLGFVGAPGCVINFDPVGPWSTALVSPGQVDFTVVLDPTFLGLDMYLQSAWLTLPQFANALGLISSNALKQRVRSN